MRLKTVIVACGLLLIFGYSDVIGSDWVEYAKNESDGNVYYYNREIINYHSNNIIRVYSKTIYGVKGKKQFISFWSEKRSKDYLLLNGYDRIDHDITSYEINCKNKTRNRLFVTLFDGTHAPFDCFYFADASTHRNIVPNSVEDSLYHTVCEKKLKTLKSK